MGLRETCKYEKIIFIPPLQGSWIFFYFIHGALPHAEIFDPFGVFKRYNKQFFFYPVRGEID
ncbi:hypothetical protein B6D60_02060 [candidate division KSB1 bacterium 4484_87]|nr:MAG: hypothetical protein B6D60_02060 [candidate division KSB1 bacterium 4484_87]